jgi:hypothetical protein
MPSHSALKIMLGSRGHTYLLQSGQWRIPVYGPRQSAISSSHRRSQDSPYSRNAVGQPSTPSMLEQASAGEAPIVAICGTARAGS